MNDPRSTPRCWACLNFEAPNDAEPCSSCTDESAFVDARAECKRLRELLAKERDDMRNELASLRDWIDWRQSQLAVEAEWDAQAVAKLLGIRIGIPIRPAIEPAVKCLIAERDALRADIDRAKEALAALREQGPVAYLYHDAIDAKSAHPWLNSTLLVLAADRKSGLRNETPLYAAPVPATVPAEPVGQPLTDAEIAAAVRPLYISDTAAEMALQCDVLIARAIERTLAERWGVTLAEQPAGFHLGATVRKKSGAAWSGRIVGSYSTALTPVGWAVESDAHPGSVQIYPEAALELVERKGGAA